MMLNSGCLGEVLVGIVLKPQSLGELVPWTPEAQAACICESQRHQIFD